MNAKQKRIPHVPAAAEVITAPPSGSSLDRASPRNATKPVTLESLTSQNEDIKDHLPIMVEWLETLDERTANDD